MRMSERIYDGSIALDLYRHCDCFVCGELRCSKKAKDSDKKYGNYMTEGMCLGMCVGTALGGNGLSFGMLIGMVVGMCIKKESE